MDKTGRASLNSFTETEKCPIQFVSLYFFFFKQKTFGVFVNANDYYTRAWMNKN